MVGEGWAGQDQMGLANNITQKVSIVQCPYLYDGLLVFFFLKIVPFRNQ